MIRNNNQSQLYLFIAYRFDMVHPVTSCFFLTNLENKNQNLRTKPRGTPYDTGAMGHCDFNL